MSAARPSRFGATARNGLFVLLGAISSVTATAEPAPPLAAQPADLAATDILVRGARPAGSTSGENRVDALVPLHLLVLVNGRSTGLAATFRLDPSSGRLFADRAELILVGIDPGRHGGLVPLDAIEGLGYSYDPLAQAVRLTARPSARRPRVTSAHIAPDPAEPQRSWGAVLNYDLEADLPDGQDWDGGARDWSLGTDAWIYTPFGTLSNLLVLTPAQGGTAARRFETTWETPLPARAATFAIGDLVSGSMSSGRSIRLGGIQLRRAFGLRRDMVTEPLLSFSGVAAVPSSVDVYIGNSRIWSGQLDEGPYRVEDIPIVGGSGNAAVTIRDEQGRTVTREVPFFAGTGLLKPGLLDFSIESGWAREDYGFANAAYGGDLLGAASLRYGVTEDLTIEAHAEGKRDAALLSLGVRSVLGHRAQVGGSLGVSRYEGRQGYLAQASVQTAWRGLRLEASTQRTSQDYADLATATAIDDLGEVGFAAARASLDMPTALDILSLSWSPPGGDPRATSLGLSTIHSVREGARDDLISISLTRDLDWGEGSIGLAGAYNLGKAALQLSLSLSMTLDGHRGQTSLSRDRGGAFVDAWVGRPLGQAVGDTGWSVGSTTNRHSDQIRATAEWRSRWGQAGLEARGGAAGRDLHGRVQGAVVLAGGHLLASGPIHDGFAVVDVGLSNVPVSLQNREVGRTDATGRILVPDLTPYATNRIAIDAADLPPGSAAGATAMEIVPANHAGVVVALNGGRRPGGSPVLVGLTDAGGTPLPVGSRARLQASGEQVVVGYGGEVYLQGASASNLLIVDTGAGTCEARFDLPPQPAVQPFIEGVACH